MKNIKEKVMGILIDFGKRHRNMITPVLVMIGLWLTLYYSAKGMWEKLCESKFRKRLVCVMTIGFILLARLDMICSFADMLTENAQEYDLEEDDAIASWSDAGNGQQENEEISNDKAVKDEVSEGETVKDEAVKDEAPEEETVKDEAVRDEAPEEETVKDEAVKDETTEEETVKDEAVKDETTENETVKDETELYEEDLYAAKDITLYVNGVDILTAPDNTVNCGNGTAVYDPDTQTLALHNATINYAHDYAGIYFVGGDINIVLSGQNSSIGIKADRNADSSTGGNINITGAGTLSILSTGVGYVSCIWSKGGNIKVNGATLLLVPSASGNGISTFRSSDDGPAASDGQHVIIEDASVTVEGLSQSAAGVSSEGGITIRNTQIKVNVEGYALNADAKSDVYISGSECELKGSNGVYANNIYIDGSDIQVDSQSSGIATSWGSSAEGNVRINDSILNITSGGGYALYAEHSMDINKCNIIINSGRHGAASSDGSMKFADSTMEIVSDRYGMFAKTDLTIQGNSNIKIKNNNAATSFVANSCIITPMEEAAVDIFVSDDTEGTNRQRYDEAPYDEACTLLESISQKYIEIKPHVHAADEAASCISSVNCADCGREMSVDPDNHVGDVELRNKKDADCIMEGYSGDKYCLSCNGLIEKGTIISPTGHHAVMFAAKKASCTEIGNIAYWHCAECDKYFSDETLFNSIDITDTVIAMKEHNYKDGVCIDCKAYDPEYKKPADTGGEDDKKDNTEDNTTNADSTESSKDNTTNTGNTESNKDTQKNSNAPAPKTGDDSSIYLIFTILLISGGTLVGMRKKIK